MKSNCFYVEMNVRWLYHLSPTVACLQSASSLRCPDLYCVSAFASAHAFPHKSGMRIEPRFNSFIYFIMNMKRGAIAPLHVHGGDDRSVAMPPLSYGRLPTVGKLPTLS